MAHEVGGVEGAVRRHRAPSPQSRIARSAVKKKVKDRTLRRLDRAFLEQLADFALVACEDCGLEQSNATMPDPWGAAGVMLGCAVCGHPYGRYSQNHDGALASLRLPSGLKVGA